MTGFVKRSAVEQALVEKAHRSGRYKLGEVWELNGGEIREALDKIQDEDVEPVRTGVWRRMKSPDEYHGDRFWCSECGWETDFEASNFCPNCGAAMREVCE